MGQISEQESQRRDELIRAMAQNKEQSPAPTDEDARRDRLVIEAAQRAQASSTGERPTPNFVDGDSGSFDDGSGQYNPNSTFRIANANAPEKSHARRIDASPNAQLAQDTMQSLIDQGATVTQSESDDVYGRGLVEVRDSRGQDVSLDLVRAGISHPTQTEQSAQAFYEGVSRRALGLAPTRREGVNQAAEQMVPETFDFNSVAIEGHKPMDRRGTFGRSFDRGVDDAQASLGGFLNYLGETTGNKALADYGREVAISNELEASFSSRKVESYEDVVKDPWKAGTYILETAGEMAPGLLADGLVTVFTLGTGASVVAARRSATALVSRAVKNGAVDASKARALKASLAAGPVISGAVQAAGDMENRLDAEQDGEHGLASTLSGVVGGAMNLLPYAAVFGDIAKAAGLGDDVIKPVVEKLSGYGKAKAIGADVLKTAAKGATADGAATLAQSVIDDVIYSNELNKDWDELTTNYVDDMLRAVIGSGLAAGGASGMAHGASAMREYNEAKRAAEEEARVSAAALEEEREAFHASFANYKGNNFTDYVREENERNKREALFTDAEGKSITPDRVAALMKEGMLKDADVVEFLQKNGYDSENAPQVQGKTARDKTLAALSERAEMIADAHSTGDYKPLAVNGIISNDMLNTLTKAPKEAVGERVAGMLHAVAKASRKTDIDLDSVARTFNRDGFKFKVDDLFRKGEVDVVAAYADFATRKEEAELAEAPQVNEAELQQAKETEAVQKQAAQAAIDKVAEQNKKAIESADKFARKKLGKKAETYRLAVERDSESLDTVAQAFTILENRTDMVTPEEGAILRRAGVSEGALKILTGEVRGTRKVNQAAEVAARRLEKRYTQFHAGLELHRENIGADKVEAIQRQVATRKAQGFVAEMMKVDDPKELSKLAEKYEVEMNHGDDLMGVKSQIAHKAFSWARNGRFAGKSLNKAPAAKIRKETAEKSREEIEFTKVKTQFSEEMKARELPAAQLEQLKKAADSKQLDEVIGRVIARGDHIPAPQAEATGEKARAEAQRRTQIASAVKHTETQLEDVKTRIKNISKKLNDIKDEAGARETLGETKEEIAQWMLSQSEALRGPLTELVAKRDSLTKDIEEGNAVLKEVSDAQAQAPSNLFDVVMAELDADKAPEGEQEATFVHEEDGEEDETPIWSKGIAGVESDFDSNSVRSITDELTPVQVKANFKRRTSSAAHVIQQLHRNPLFKADGDILNDVLDVVFEKVGAEKTVLDANETVGKNVVSNIEIAFEKNSTVNTAGGRGNEGGGKKSTARGQNKVIRLGNKDKEQLKSLLGAVRKADPRNFGGGLDTSEGAKTHRETLEDVVRFMKAKGLISTDIAPEDERSFDRDPAARRVSDALRTAAARRRGVASGDATTPVDKHDIEVTEFNQGSDKPTKKHMLSGDDIRRLGEAELGIDLNTISPDDMDFTDIRYLVADAYMAGLSLLKGFRDGNKTYSIDMRKAMSSDIVIHPSLGRDSSKAKDVPDGEVAVSERGLPIAERKASNGSGWTGPSTAGNPLKGGAKTATLSTKKPLTLGSALGYMGFKETGDDAKYGRAFQESGVKMRSIDDFLDDAAREHAEIREVRDELALEVRRMRARGKRRPHNPTEAAKYKKLRDDLASAEKQLAKAKDTYDKFQAYSDTRADKTIEAQIIMTEELPRDGEFFGESDVDNSADALSNKHTAQDMFDRHDEISAVGYWRGDDAQVVRGDSTKKRRTRKERLATDAAKGNNSDAFQDAIEVRKGETRVTGEVKNPRETLQIGDVPSLISNLETEVAALKKQGFTTVEPTEVKDTARTGVKSTPEASPTVSPEQHHGVYTNVANMKYGEDFLPWFKRALVNDVRKYDSKPVRERTDSEKVAIEARQKAENKVTATKNAYDKVAQDLHDKLDALKKKLAIEGAWTKHEFSQLKRAIELSEKQREVLKSLTVDGSFKGDFIAVSPEDAALLGREYRPTGIPVGELKKTFRNVRREIPRMLGRLEAAGEKPAKLAAEISALLEKERAFAAPYEAALNDPALKIDVKDIPPADIRRRDHAIKARKMLTDIKNGLEVTRVMAAEYAAERIGKGRVYRKYSPELVAKTKKLEHLQRIKHRGEVSNSDREALGYPRLREAIRSKPQSARPHDIRELAEGMDMYTLREVLQGNTTPAIHRLRKLIENTKDPELLDLYEDELKELVNFENAAAEARAAVDAIEAAKNAALLKDDGFDVELKSRPATEAELKAALAKLTPEVTPSRVIKGVRKLFVTVRSRLERINPNLADALYTRSGDGTGIPSFEREARALWTKHQRAVDGALEGLDARGISEAWRDMTGGSPKTNEGKKLHAAIKAFTDEINKANPNYKLDGAPIVLDMPELNSRRSEFLEILNKHKVANAESMMHDLFDSKGVGDFKIYSDAPKPTGGKTFSQRIRPAYDALYEAGFIDKDGERAKTRFLASGSAFAAWSQIFGARDGKGRFHENAMYDYYLAQVPPGQRAEVRKMVNAMTGALSRETPAWLNMLNSASFAFSAATILWFSGIASIPEVAVAVGRTRGDIDGVIKDLLKSARGRDRRAYVEFAKDMGVISPALIKQSMMSLSQDNMLTAGKVSQRITETVFKYNGQEFVTEFTRSMSAHFGRKYLESHAAKAAAGDAYSARALKELGIDAATVNEFVAETKANHGKPNVTTKAGSAFQMALLRFTDESVSNPHTGQMPLWMSDPRFSMVASLKKFFYAYWDNFHRAIYSEMKKRNLSGGGIPSVLAPLMISAAVMVPLAAVAEVLRELIKYPAEMLPFLSSKNLSRAQDRTAGDWVGSIIGATGGLAQLQMVQAAYEQREYGRNFMMSLAGPTFTFAADVLKGDIYNKNPSRLTPLNQIPWLRRPMDKSWQEWLSENQGDEY